jgi:hypothetical protein
MPPSRKPFGRTGVPLLLSLALLAVGAACSSGDGSGDANAPADSPPAVTSTGTATDSPAPATTSASPTTTASPKPTAYATTSTAHAEPWKDKNADFGYVTKARVVSGGVQISFDRATWLFAADVPAWNKANPTHQVEEADDYAIGNVSKKERTFILRTGAKIFGSIILSDQPEPKKISAAQLVSRVDSAFGGVTCWIYHRYGGLTGDVVQLEEQYRP